MGEPSVGRLTLYSAASYVAWVTKEPTEQGRMADDALACGGICAASSQGLRGIAAIAGLGDKTA